MLSDSESEETNDIHQLTINEHYARAFEYKKEREELAQLKEKYGSDFEEQGVDNDDGSDSESDESEDEDGEELTPAVDAAVLRTLALIRKKDPGIYDTQKAVYEEEERRTSSAKLPFKADKDKSKPITYKQQAYKALVGDDNDEPLSRTHAEEQEELRLETISAFHQAVKPEVNGGDSDNEDDNFLVLREKTKDEIEQEEASYKEFLEREVEDIRELVWVDEGPDTLRATEEDDVKRGQSVPTRTKKSKGKSKGALEAAKQSDQEFLMNYILNRGWIDHSARHLPTFNEVTSRGKAKNAPPAEAQNAALEENEGHGDLLLDAEREEEDGFDDIAENFEASYNFRFEEPGGSTIARHPRVIQSLVRRPDTTRKDARERKKLRKEEELMQKKEEVRRMKSLKMNELRAKLEKVGKEGGWEASALAELDLEGDWDPDAHDEQMRGLYDEEDFYGEQVEEKPTWDDDIDIGDLEPGPSKKTKKRKRNIADDQGAVDVDEMDADIEKKPRPEDEDDEEWDGTEEMRKRKLNEYMEEIYAMDFNDMVADIPTRFKYTRVAPAAYSLTPAEILMASDKELNAYMGVKKLAPYRKSRDWDKHRGERLAELKSSIAHRSWGGVSPSMSAGGPSGGVIQEKKKRKGKKERNKAKATDPQSTAAMQGGEIVVEPKKKKRKRNKGGEGA